MKEIRILLFNEVKDDSVFKGYVGGTSTDPRFYYQWTPKEVKKFPTTATQPAYAVYYRSGTIRTTNRVDIAGRDDQVFTLEIYAKTGAIAEDIADGLVEKFRDQQFTTDSFVILRTYGSVLGAAIFDEDRKLFTVSVNLYFTKILAR